MKKNNQTVKVFVIILFYLLGIKTSAQMTQCRAILSADTLILENNKIKRIFLWNNGGLQSICIINKRNGKAISGAAAKETADVTFPGVTEIRSNGSFNVTKFPSTSVSYGYTSAEVVTKTGDLEFKRVFKLYDDCPAIVCDYYLKGKTGTWAQGSSDGDNFKNIEDDNIRKTLNARAVVTDKIGISGNHWEVKSIEFFDVSDINNNLVQEYCRLIYRQENKMRGNILFARDQQSNSGFFLLKEAPTSSIQLQYPGYDFSVKWGEITVSGLGVSPSDVNDSGWIKGYSVVTGVDEGSDEQGLLQALRNYQDHQRVYKEERDGMILSNTWGDRNRDTRVNEKFILQEIDAAAKLGISHMQVDDGWQKGISSNSAYGGSLLNIWHNPFYWNVDSAKFPHGLEGIIGAAKNKGIKMSLWFNPSTDSGFVNWKKDANVLIDQYNRYGISMWKIDGVQVINKPGDENFKKFLDTVMFATNNQAVFNLDVTAGHRFGYHYMNTYGNLFLENRYTDWGNYYPHYTLRNLWQLSRYMPAQRLQIEFLNKWRNSSKYPADDVLAPASYSFDYLFAITMIAQPLAWFEVSGLPDEAFAVSKLVATYKSIVKDLHGGDVFPIGDEPNGFNWTGFQSVYQKRGYILLFRENNKSSLKKVNTVLGPGKSIKLKLLAGEGHNFNALTGENGNIDFELTNRKSFALYEYKLL